MKSAVVENYADRKKCFRILLLNPTLTVYRSTQDDSDPVVQIGKVLNAHMDSLQWIDQTSAQLQRKVDEVSRAHQGEQNRAKESAAII